MKITNSFKDLAGGDLDVFTPKPKSQGTPAPTAKQLERVGQDQGFTVDNLPIARKLLKSGRVASKDKAQPMTLRIRIADWNRFSAFCERNGYTVADGFEKLSILAEGL
jgi:hypothetical protein